jgi:hypothetical protein
MAEFSRVGMLVYPRPQRFGLSRIAWPFARLTVRDSTIELSPRGLLSRIWKPVVQPLETLSTVRIAASDILRSQREPVFDVVPIEFVCETGELRGVVLFVLAQRHAELFFAQLLELGVQVAPSDATELH